MKRRTVDNPFIKTENQSWELSSPASLNRSISPPLTNRRHREDRDRCERQGSSSNSSRTFTPPNTTGKSDTAAVEAGEIEIEDHVSFFSSKLLAARRPELQGQPRLSHEQWLDLYQRNLTDRGHHFVIHQHDHPIAGTHYDLRLQCNATSSVSFAIMYGLPGDPNSKRLNRGATETRVHNLWNHLIETASHETGTMLLWDTGEYTVIPYESSGSRGNRSKTTTTGSSTDSDSEGDGAANGGSNTESEPVKLHRAFQNRKIKLRLSGIRLPKNYTISLRLNPEDDRVGQPLPPAFKRRRTNPNLTANIPAPPRRRRTLTRAQVETSSDSSRPASPDRPDLDSADEVGVRQHQQPKTMTRLPRTNSTVLSLHRLASPPRLSRAKSSTIGNSEGNGLQNASSPSTPTKPEASPNPAPSPVGFKLPKSDNNTANNAGNGNGNTTLDEDAQIRLHNAYPGATNSINSIHQRRWFLSLDRAASGFRPTNEMAFGRRIWERAPASSNHPRGRHSRAVVETDTETDTKPACDNLAGFEPFYVLGRDFETSVLTGRKAADVARDEGLIGFRPRGGWRAVTD
ncbi:hypothetical protein HRR83_003052 [Exophiala dermatitidis]|uniref:DNA ligase D 3'-phosphoesterase domain-containing protein n=2 Tax=Exophiala dermatitidis TaxID=5970 RepID=H6BNK0_EXODN|nr:uncharacterized protein HMPREF1120_00591 [Exophiala dermatitidis NIH/UT8656]KAJ4504813.1 hypothetical protein HRR75_007626 [Exophiala dermatitidis]EHY52377.1 hypothetical protein HMPREF1120_00591 [Exophiala dermatitidis NIH/UT8656]KAJ4506404.1 hypothetical protein HRR73_008203 [Exophiala dermatitidis]KAJ4506985.1 hypothetical protein HRR74_008302 [Exophiala dermatitidis]KAJ4547989.1 hypothetical protein HRR76_000608 [Exophiala dermatitidis]